MILGNFVSGKQIHGTPPATVLHAFFLHASCFWYLIKVLQVQLLSTFMAGQPTPPNGSPPRNKDLVRPYYSKGGQWLISPY